MNSIRRNQTIRRKFCLGQLVITIIMMMGRKVCQRGVVAFTTGRQVSSSRNGFDPVAVTVQQRFHLPQRQQQQLQKPPLRFCPSVVMYSTASASDRSAIAKSRTPFRMPKNSPDDSTIVKSTSSSSPSSSSSSSVSWNRLGLLTELCDCLTNELRLPQPTPVQSLVIPQLLLQQAATQQDQKESLAFLAATG
jgi:hypothetical protein